MLYILSLSVHNAYKLSISYFGWGKMIQSSTTLFLNPFSLMRSVHYSTLQRNTSLNLLVILRGFKTFYSKIFAVCSLCPLPCRVPPLRTAHSQRVPIIIVLRALCGLLVASHASFVLLFFSFLCRQKGVGSEFPSNG